MYTASGTAESNADFVIKEVQKMSDQQDYVDLYSYSNNENGGDNRNGKKGKKKMARWKKVLIAVISVVLILCGGVLCAAWYFVGDIEIDRDFPKTDSELGVNSAEVHDETITNIALFGIDSRTHDDQGHADAFMILSIDNKHNKLKLISILRDSKVEIEGYGQSKITNSYWWGSAPLAIKTLNQNFNMNVRDYVRVNFDQLADVIDAVGGVEIDVTAEELEEINFHMHGLGIYDSDLYETGMVTLTGNQAVSYARIRNVGTDIARAGRQQEVLSALLGKVDNLSVADYPAFIKKIAPLVTTSLDYTEMISLAGILAGDPELESYVIPGEEEDAWGGIDDSGQWVWEYDLDAAADHIHEIIYETGEEDNSTDSTTASASSDAA